MNLQIIVRGDLPEYLNNQILVGERAVKGAMQDGGRGLQKEWRGQVVSAGLGQRLANAVRQNTYPRQQPSLNAASLVFAQPNRNEAASAADVLDAHNDGVLIRGKTGLWLAIPLGPAAKMRGPKNKRITPLGWEQKTGQRLTFVYRKGDYPLLVATGEGLPRKASDPVTYTQSRRRGARNVTTPIFILVPQVKLPKRLALDVASMKWADRLPTMILERWKEPR